MMKLKVYARLSVGLFGLALAVGLNSRALAIAADEEVVPGEVLVGIKASFDGPGTSGTLTSAIGSEIGSIPDIHVHQIKLNSGVTIDQAIAQLTQRPEVAFVEPNHVVHALSTPNDPRWSVQYGPKQIQADVAWDYWNPQWQVVIAIVDTGVDYNHPDLANKIFADANGSIIGFSAYNGGNPLDDNGHGSHCAGIAAAQTNDGTGIAGVAGWNGDPTYSDTYFTQIMPCKVLSGSGSGSDFSVAQGITFATNNGANVISMSLGGGFSSTMDSACQNAWNNGLVIVAAAGNSGSSSKSYPAGFNHVIAVAATDSSNRLASYSNYGSWVQVAAPGSSVYSCWRNGGYATASGTSMACPHVAGEVALVWANNAGLANADMFGIITSNFDSYTPYNGRTIAGGRVNAYKAILAAGP